MISSTAPIDLDDLERRRANLTENDRSLVDKILARRPSLPAGMRVAAGNVQAMKIRHHGDFHLGQMLIAKDDVFIIDFEGEPRRSLEDRRRKAPAARDVAGLIRSIDYSATAALERAIKSAPDEQAKIARALDGWRDASVAAFLAGYRNSLNDPRLWPTSSQDADRLLDFFLLEKAFYESNTSWRIGRIGCGCLWLAPGAFFRDRSACRHELAHVRSLCRH